MTAAFEVRSSTAFERAIRKLARHHPDLVDLRNEIQSILSADPYNRSRRYPIKTLAGVAPGAGQYRLRLRRFRFRYDIAGDVVLLHSCALRREDIYP